MWIACFLLSLCTWISLMICSFSINNSKPAHRFKYFNAFLVAVAVSSVIIFYPINRAPLDPGIGNSVLAMILSVWNTAQSFAFRGQFSTVMDGVASCTPGWELPYLIWTATVLVFAAITTFGFMLSFAKNISASMKYWGNLSRSVYVFSELNEKSILLAKDIRKSNRRALIVFCGVGETEELEDWIDDARILRAVCFKKNITSIHFEKTLRRKQTIIFCLIQENEDQNLDHTLKLIKKYRNYQSNRTNRLKIRIYVFSQKEDSDFVLSAVDPGNIRVVRIDIARSLINHFLWTEEGGCLFDKPEKDSNGDKTISAVIVGMGHRGTAMIKALSWYTKIPGYRLEINAFDKDVLAKEKFAAIAPGLVSLQTKETKNETVSRYTLNIHAGVDVDTKSFYEKIKKISNATYVLISLGSDELNYRTALHLRTDFQRMNITPVIQAVVYDTHTREALQGAPSSYPESEKYNNQPVDGLRTLDGKSYDIDFIWDKESIFRESVLLNTEVEAHALMTHNYYYHEKDFWRYPNFYNSAISAVLHKKALEHCNVPGVNEPLSNRTPLNNEVLLLCEFYRWSFFMRSDGFVYGEQKDYLAKTHPDLSDGKENRS